MLSTICLFGTLIIMGLLIWYVRTLLGRVMMFVNDIRITRKEIKDFSNHLEYVYSLETYHGDETLNSLLKHTKDLSKKLRNINTSLESLEEHQEVADTTEETKESK